MTIKEVEQRTGLPRSVVRFYEKEGLIAPRRGGENGYRDYQEEDVALLTRIIWLSRSPSQRMTPVCAASSFAARVNVPGQTTAAS